MYDGAHEDDHDEDNPADEHGALNLKLHRAVDKLVNILLR